MATTQQASTSTQRNEQDVIQARKVEQLLCTHFLNDEFVGTELLFKVFGEGFDVNEQTCSKNGAPDLVAAKCFGDVEGVELGDKFASCRELSQGKVHRGLIAGIFGEPKVGGLFGGGGRQVRRGG
ncbi:hypothetical protein MMC14_009280 [Varicellaria rhodocarpa]|nr:hypothetical protein [Varicellaria rhodocarpa]